MAQDEAQRLLWEQQIQNGFNEATRRGRACRDNHRYYFVGIKLPGKMILHSDMKECVLVWFKAEYPVPEGVGMEVSSAPPTNE